MKPVIPPRPPSRAGMLRSWISRAWKAAVTRMFVSYRPDLHYMRGPGPKWRQGHGRSWDDLH